MALTKPSTESFFVWATRGSIGVLLYLATEMRADIKTLNASVPVIQQQIIDMKLEENRMKDKIFSELKKHYPAKKEEEFNISQLIKFRP
jgi:hypothetical protein